MVKVEIFINFGSSDEIVAGWIPFFVKFVLLAEIPHDGMALGDGCIVFGIDDDWYFLERVDFSKLGGSIL